MKIQNTKYFCFLLSAFSLVAASEMYLLVLDNIFYTISLKLYLCLGVLSMAVVFFNESFLNCIYENKKIFNLKYYAIISLSCLMLTAAYGPSIFINYYKYDDWMYMSYSMGEINFQFVNSPINEHYIPLLKIILYYNSLYSDSTFFGYSLILYLSIMFLTSSLSRLIATHIKDLNALFITMMAFSVWPTFDESRTWFGGAFWLTMPIATLLVAIILIKEIIADRSPSKNLFLLGVFLFTTVFISSQVLLPIIFICAYLLPYLLAEETRAGVKKHIFKIALISTLPSIITFLARPELPTKRANFYGLIDGSILRNADYFVKNKVFFIDKSSYASNYSIFLIVVFAFLCMYFLIKSRVSINKKSIVNEGVLSLYLLGLLIFFIFIVQVGLGRGWDSWIVLNEYYATMPLVGFFITFSIIIYILINCLTTTKYYIIPVYIMLIALMIYSCVYNYPSEKYIKQIMHQKEFMRDLGEMTCAKLSKVNDGQQIYLEYKMPFAKLKNAEEIFRAPQTFINSMSNDTFLMLSFKTVSHECNEEIGKISMIKSFGNKEKYDSNEEINFYKKYYHTVN